MSDPLPNLLQLAEAYNIETSYFDDQGRHVQATPEALLLVLRTLGAFLERVDQAGDALRARRIEQWQRVVEPVAVAWDGRGTDIALRLPARQITGTLGCRLELESGETRFWQAALAELPVSEAADVEGASYRVLRLPLAGEFPLGYHRLTLQHQDIEHGCLILSPPNRAYELPGPPLRTWGGFLPLYAVRSKRNWGAGNFTDLENLISYVQGLGGGLVGTLPLMAAFLDEPFEPSPYSPASRLFWNEFYLDVMAIPELAGNRAARALLSTREFQNACSAQRALELVDYRGQMALKRQVLELLAAGFFAEPGGRLDAFRQYISSQPRAEDYARFRAAVEKQRASWWSWPERERAGDLREGDFDPAARRYHLYVQWLADEQLCRVAERARAKGPGLYLDFPLGVNPDSYDAWRDRASFAHEISAGAPPDSFFTKGQDWGFPPMHPENIRVEGYRYLRDCLHAHMRHAGVLRIDHMMGLHRFFWVPRGMGPKQGVYVRYPHEELYAVYSLESNRHHTLMVGEDLGTVPPAVRPAMAQHNFHRLYVGQYEFQPDWNRPIAEPPAGVIASLNTHDMPTFAAFWDILDLEDRQALGLFDDDGRRHETDRRRAIRAALCNFLRQKGLLGDKEDAASVLQASLRFMADSPALAVLVNFEDLWLATLPQNCPGTWRERPNWQRKAGQNLEDFERVPGLRATLLAVDQTRRESAAKKT